MNVSQEQRTKLPPSGRAVAPMTEPHIFPTVGEPTVVTDTLEAALERRMRMPNMTTKPCL